jgi:branched-chain amino acid transport system permease protein
MPAFIIFGATFLLGVFSGSNYIANILITIFLHAMPAIGLSLLVGYTGQISLGHAAFYGLGAYGAAILTTRTHIDPWISITLTSLVVSILAYGIGWIIFRTRGHHLAIATLGLGIVVSVGFVELRQWTGGANGLSGIPPLSIGHFALNTDTRYFFVAWGACLLMYLAAINLVRSPIGLLMRGVAESERAANSLGTNVATFKRTILMLSAFMAAFAGGMYAHYVGFISPQPFGTGFSIRLLLMVAIGGFQSIPGVVLGTAFVTAVTEPLQQLGYYDVVAFGLLLVIVMVWTPQGLFIGLTRLFSRVSFSRVRRGLGQ